MAQVLRRATRPAEGAIEKIGSDPTAVLKEVLRLHSKRMAERSERFVGWSVSVTVTQVTQIPSGNSRLLSDLAQRERRSVNELGECVRKDCVGSIIKIRCPVASCLSKRLIKDEVDKLRIRTQGVVYPNSPDFEEPLWLKSRGMSDTLDHPERRRVSLAMDEMGKVASGKSATLSRCP